MGLCVAKQNSFILDTTSFFRKIFEKPEISSAVEHDWPSQCRPTPTVAPREVKLRFWFFAAGCRFLLHNVPIFFANRIVIWIAWTFSRYIDAYMMDTDWYRFSLKKYGFPQRNCGVSENGSQRLLSYPRRYELLQFSNSFKTMLFPRHSKN